MSESLESKVIHILDKNEKSIEARVMEIDGTFLNFPANFVNFHTVFESLPRFKERPDDIWLCSYPKSDDFDCVPSPRVMNTHVPWMFLPPQIKESKIIYLMRNPLSVALSWYHQTKALYGYEGTPRDFIEAFAVQFYSFYGSWFNHVKDFFKASQHNQNIHVLCYEEMRMEPASVIAGLSAFLGLSRSEEQISRVVELTSFSSMKAHFQSNINSQVAGTEKSHTFVRKGEIAEWRNHVTPEFLEAFMQIYEAELKDFPELIERIKLY